MRAFMTYVSYEMLVLYLLVAAMYAGATAMLVGVLFARGYVAGPIALCVPLLISYAGMLGQVRHVMEASAEMRRQIRGSR